MGNLPVGYFGHRVMLAGGDPIVFGGYSGVGAENLQTYRIRSGTPAPVRLGDMNLRHTATNTQQGMGWLMGDGKLHAIGDEVGGAQRQSDILNPSTGVWTLGPLNGASQGVSGVSPVMMNAPGLYIPFLAWGDTYSINQRVCSDYSGNYYTCFDGASPANPGRPYTHLVFEDGRYIWAIFGSQGAGVPALIRLDSENQSAAFPYWGPAQGCFQDPTWWSNFSCGLKYSQDLPGIYFIFGGLQSGAGVGSKQTYMLDTINPLVPYTLKLADMPRARLRATCEVLNNGLIAVIGGEAFGDGTKIAEIDLYNPSDDTWIEGPKLPEAVARHSSVKLPSGNVLIVGGRTASNTASKQVIYLDKNGFSLKKQDD